MLLVSARRPRPWRVVGRCGCAGDPIGERLAKVARERGILLMMCDQCAVRRNLAEGTLEQCGKGEVTAKGTVEGVAAGCFPQLYQALGGNPRIRSAPPYRL